MIPIIQIATVYFIFRAVIKKVNSHNAQPTNKRARGNRQSRQIKHSKQKPALHKAKTFNQRKPLTPVTKRPAEVYSSKKAVKKAAYKDASWIKEEDTWIKDN